jgi:hypothetical protein
MPFAEELERTLDALADRLHADVARQVRTVASELAAAASAERAALTRPPVERDVAVPPVDPTTGRLTEAVKALSLSRSLSETLETLVDESGRIAARVALLLVWIGSGEGFQVWRFLGFDRASNALPSFDVARRDAGVIADAADSRLPARSGRIPAFAAPVEEDRGGSREFGDHRLALPLVIAGEVVAVLYADGLESSENGRSEAANCERLEVLALHASRCLEALTAIKAAALVAPAGASMSDGADEDTARRYARGGARAGHAGTDRHEQAPA